MCFILGLVLILLGFFKVKSQAIVTASEPVILNTSYVIILVLSKSVYFVLQQFLENRVDFL